MIKKADLLFVATVLGLGWAMRGHFGHEWGASWAGAMGALAVLIVSRRMDWIRRGPVLAALGAIGWAVGGMMSYGLVIGYCRSVTFLNSLYGYTMLVIIGGLYGFIGGGLFGLGLESGEKKSPQWPALISEMLVGGFIVWGLLIYQMEWFMTPPRSELWAGCLGAAIALSWFLYRHEFKRALRVAAYSALGAGFGFAFGNFVQLLGNTMEISYNWWNVMEFTLGFFGGLGMVYAVLTREWPKSVGPSTTGNWIAIAFVFFFIPVTNYINGFNREYFINLAGRLHIYEAEHFANLQFIYGGTSIIIFVLLAIMVWKRCSSGNDKNMTYCIPALLLITTIQYNLFTYLRLGTFFKTFSFRFSESLYIFIIILIFTIWYSGLRKTTSFPGGNIGKDTWKHWRILIAGMIIFLVAITIISINIHGELPGAHNRFQFD